MTIYASPLVPMGDDAPDCAAPQQKHWLNPARLSSGLAHIERFLAASAFDQAPWLVVAFAAGIAGWFAGANVWQWTGLIALGLAAAMGAAACLPPDGTTPYLRRAVIAAAVVMALGCGFVWAKSALVGAVPIARPVVVQLQGKLLARQEQPAEQRVRLRLAVREPGSGRPILVRVNLDMANDRPELTEGAVLRLRARIMPPAPPMLPGGYNFARTAWFSGIAATGSVLGPVTLVQPGDSDGAVRRLRRRLSHHVQQNLSGSPGALAAAFASGDRGAIAQTDEDAMRDAGLTHLLSISGLHVSAVIAAAYFLAIRLLALVPWLALRVRLPILAAAGGALAGIGYTVLTGAEVPTIRSCIAAVLVMLALVLGREPLSMRMIAIAALIVLLVWPEAVVSPGFQMSFASVIAIVALHSAAPMRAYNAPREEPLWARWSRNLALLLLTGVVIELALMPIGLFHFHRAGIYGALANVIAIPLTTLASMPLIALALLFDAVGAGAPLWWLAGKSLELLLALAHWTAGMPGAVTMMPAMGEGAFVLFVAGGLWLALWRGKVRLLGLVPALIGQVLLLQVQPPDLMISGDGRHVGITGETPGELLVLRQTRSEYARDNLTETAGMDGEPRLLDDWPGAQCNDSFCLIAIERGGRSWQILMSRGKAMAPERALAAACERADIVVSDRYLPRSCRPRWFKADRDSLERSGGLTVDLTRARINSVAQDEGEHGWWRPPERLPRRYPVARATQSGDADAASATLQPRAVLSPGRRGT